MVVNPQSSAIEGTHSTVILPPSSSGVSNALTPKIFGGGTPSLIPPVGIAGPIINALTKSS